MNELIIIFIVGFFAGLIQNYVGFAFGILSAVFLMNFFNIHESIVMSLFGAFLGQILNLLTLKNKDIKPATFFILGGILGVFIIYFFIRSIEFKTLYKAIGWILITTALLGAFTPKKFDLGLKGKRWLEFIVGFLAGNFGVIGSGFGIIPSVWCIYNSYAYNSYKAIMVYFNLVVITLTGIVFLIHYKSSFNHTQIITILLSVLLSHLIFNSIKIKKTMNAVKLIISIIIILQGIYILFNQ